MLFLTQGTGPFCRPIVIAIVFILSVSILGSAQTVRQSGFIVRGKIFDSAQGKPVAYATISMQRSGEEKVVGTAYSGEDGSFEVRSTVTGKYILEISSVGFTTYNKDIVIEAAGDLHVVDVGKILLASASSSLQHVTVTARKKLVEQRPGMLVYNAENDLTNKGGTATDVLRKTPVLTVDAQGNVSMRGNSNLKILINGKYSGQVARNPADALNMIPSEIIKSVEVITTPSAKYDAEGAAGVINIITKRSKKSLDGSLELVASNFEQAFNPRIALAGSKWNLSFHGHLHNRREKETSFTDRTQFDNGQPSLLLHQEVRKDNYAPHGSQDFSATYQADSLTELSLGVHTWFGKWPDDRNISVLSNAPDGSIVDSYGQTTNQKDRYVGNDLSAGLTRKFTRPGQELNVLFQFSPSSSHSPYDLAQTGKDATPRYKERNDNNSVNREWTAQIDYQQPLSRDGRFSMENGVKMILRRVSNIYDVYSSGQTVDDLVRDAARSDHFVYHQNVWAGYTMLKATLPASWYLEGGLRYEKTDIQGRLQQAGTSFTSNFANLIPTATLSKKINADQTLSLSYTRRLTRPYIWDLSPNVDASDPKNISTGNPQLRPELATQAELTYGFTKSTNFFVNASLFLKQTDNAIIEYSRIDTSGTTITSKQNLSANKTYGVNISSSATISDRWSMNGNLNVSYLDFSSPALQILRDGWMAEVNINSTVRLNNGYSLQGFADFNSKAVTLQGFQTSRYFYSLAMKKNLPKANITATLSAINFFGAYVSQAEYTKGADFTNYTGSWYYNRAIKLTVSWEFGGLHVRKEGKKIDNNDINGRSRG
jgi:outer membrane receptor protein involved in Fe transport